ncbi:hypothetical protein NQZ70_08356 [Sorangium sp. Soce836]|nr:hypothetical protein NQZ70_08356 [Sorangium sp. Soce836]
MTILRQLCNHGFQAVKLSYLLRRVTCRFEGHENHIERRFPLGKKIFS